MANFTFNVASNATGSQSLQNILETVKSNYTTSDSVKIQLTDAGRYTLTKRFTLKCNFELNGFTGKDGAKSEIYFTKAAFPDNTVITGDGFLSFEGYISQNGTNSGNRIEVKLSNLIVNLENKRFIGHPNQKELLLLKFWGCNKVTVFNVDNYLNQGAITNLDVRESDNITVESCILGNRNATYGDTAGGVLWIRGGCRNVNIFANKIYKNGNDEVLAIWGGTAAHEYNMEDINIFDNEITYGSPSEPQADLDVMIAIHSPSDIDNGYAHNWKNFNFTGNIITCNSAVKRVIWITHRNFDTVENYNINSNTIIHTAFSDTNTNNYIEDIEIRNFDTTKPSAHHDSVCIKGNRFIAREHIAGKNRHRLLILNNSKATFSGNTIDSVGQTTETNSKTYNGVIVFTTIGDNCEIIANGNYAKGIDVLHYSWASSTSRSQRITLKITDNTFEDGSMIYLRNVLNTDVLFKGNTVQNAQYYSLFQEMANTGNLTVSDNVFLLSASSGVLYEKYDTNTPAIDYLTVTGNTLVGYDNNVLNSLSAIGSKNTIANNVITKF